MIFGTLWVQSFLTIGRGFFLIPPFIKRLELLKSLMEPDGIHVTVSAHLIALKNSCAGYILDPHREDVISWTRSKSGVVL